MTSPDSGAGAPERSSVEGSAFCRLAVSSDVRRRSADAAIVTAPESRCATAARFKHCASARHFGMLPPMCNLPVAE